MLRTEAENAYPDDDAQLKGEALVDIREEAASGSRDSFSTDQADDDPPAATNLVTVSNLDGVPLFYARAVALRPQSFSVDPRSATCSPGP